MYKRQPPQGGYGAPPQGGPPQGGYPQPGMQAQPGFGQGAPQPAVQADKAWKWHYSRLFGVMYGPIPVGIIFVVIGVIIWAAVGN